MESIIKKYKIRNYQKMADPELLHWFIVFRDKLDQSSKKKMDHNSIKEAFSLFLNLHNISAEILNRFPEAKDRIDFHGELEEVFQKNSIHKSEN